MSDEAKPFILSPVKFATEFNLMVLGAYREITAQDVREMTECGLIGKYGFYLHSDLHTVISILKYEQLRNNRQKRQEIRDSDGTIHCRRCGALLADKGGKKGRPKEYCADCECFRAKERYRKWSVKRRVIVA